MSKEVPRTDLVSFRATEQLKRDLHIEAAFRRTTMSDLAHEIMERGVARIRRQREQRNDQMPQAA